MRGWYKEAGMIYTYSKYVATTGENCIGKPARLLRTYNCGLGSFSTATSLGHENWHRLSRSIMTARLTLSSERCGQPQIYKCPVYRHTCKYANPHSGAMSSATTKTVGSHARVCPRLIQSPVRSCKFPVCQPFSDTTLQEKARVGIGTPYERQRRDSLIKWGLISSAGRIGLCMVE
jgi:hypothetical protein